MKSTLTFPGIELDNEKCKMNAALAELDIRISLIDLAKARHELVHFLQLKLEAIDKANFNQCGCMRHLLRPGQVEFGMHPFRSV